MASDTVYNPLGATIENAELAGSITRDKLTGTALPQVIRKDQYNSTGFADTTLALKKTVSFAAAELEAGDQIIVECNPTNATPASYGTGYKLEISGSGITTQSLEITFGSATYGGRFVIYEHPITTANCSMHLSGEPRTNASGAEMFTLVNGAINKASWITGAFDLKLYCKTGNAGSAGAGNWIFSIYKGGTA